MAHYIETVLQSSLTYSEKWFMRRFCWSGIHERAVVRVVRYIGWIMQIDSSALMARQDRRAASSFTTINDANSERDLLLDASQWILPMRDALSRKTCFHSINFACWPCHPQKAIFFMPEMELSGCFCIAFSSAAFYIYILA